jgi:hypothetical protein
MPRGGSSVWANVFPCALLLVHSSGSR